MLNIKKQLYTDIVAYCKINDINDVDKFCSDLLEKAFVSEKYGSTPQILPTKIVEKKEENVLVEPKISLPLQDDVIEVKPIQQEQITEHPKKVFKKANLNDDYKIYDNL